MSNNNPYGDFQLPNFNKDIAKPLEVVPTAINAVVETGKKLLGDSARRQKMQEKYDNKKVKKAKKAEVTETPQGPEADATEAQRQREHELAMADKAIQLQAKMTSTHNNQALRLAALPGVSSVNHRSDGIGSTELKFRAPAVSKPGSSFVPGGVTDPIDFAAQIYAARLRAQSRPTTPAPAEAAPAAPKTVRKPRAAKSNGIDKDKAAAATPKAIVEGTSKPKGIRAPKKSTLDESAAATYED